jgi:DNA mismatch repair protein MutS2
VKSISTAFSSNHQDVESKLDIRGFTKGEAGKIVEDFLDKVLLSNNFEVQIIHGVGNGVLKKVVWAKAKEYKDLKKIWHPQAEQGGEGITLIQL